MIEVEVEDEAWAKAVPDAEAVVVRAAEAVFSSPAIAGEGDHEVVEGAGQAPHSTSAPSVGFADSSPASRGADWSITVLLTDDEAVRALNAQYRGKDTPTNVLSFPAPETAAPHLGDICLAYGVCVREARAQGKTLAAHLTHLTAHGVLHLLGYDHETEAEAEDMEGLERAILAGLGLPDPYETDAQR